MQYKGKRVNLSNYNKEFENLSRDSRDVIRSAILDDTPLGVYVDKFGRDPYMLWQIKLGLDEYLDSRWFSIAKSGEALYKVRELSNKGINIDILLDFVTEETPDVYLGYVLRWYEMGVNVEKYKFDILPEKLLNVFDFGLKRGFPMYLFNTGKAYRYSERYIKSCLVIMSNRKSIEGFLDGDWDESILETLGEYSKSKYYDRVIKYTEKCITLSLLEALLKCVKSGMLDKDLERIFVVDEEGYYVYDSFRVEVFLKAFEKDLDFSSLLDTSLSIKDLYLRLDELELTKNTKIKGRLGKY